MPCCSPNGGWISRLSPGAAGLAGGIGLSGGACGALGAAVWIIGIDALENGVDDKIQKSEVKSRIRNTMDRFLEQTHQEYECAKITQKRFETIGDHARYLKGGGCSEIIEMLAAGVWKRSEAQ